MEEFPEFGAKERSQSGPAFPFIFEQHLGSKELVDAYETELRKKAE